MSEFSEAIKAEIRKSKRTLLELSDASGLSMDHISKMRQGKRLPQNEDKMRRLIQALQCSDTISNTLFSMYKIERVGADEWNCMLEIKRMLEFHVTYSTIPLEGGRVLDQEMRFTTILKTKNEAYYFLQKLLSSETYETGKKTLRMITEELPEVLIEILVQQFNHSSMVCEHIFSLKKNSIPDGSFYNIRYTNQIMPLIRSGGKYIPYYDYEDEGDAFIANWFISGTWVIGLNRNMDGGIVIWEPGQAQYMSELFDKKKRRKRQLVTYYDDIAMWLEEFYERRERYLETETGTLFRKNDVKNYYIESSPCLLLLAPLDMIESHLLVEGEAKRHLMEVIRHRCQQIQREKLVHFFNIEGVERIALEGRLDSIPEAIYSPLTMEERRWVLEHYVQWMKDHEDEYYMIDSSQIELAPQTAIYSMLSPIDSEVSFCMTIGDNLVCSIREYGLAEKLDHFCRMLEEGEFVYKKEESMKLMERIIKKM